MKKIISPFKFILLVALFTTIGISNVCAQAAKGSTTQNKTEWETIRDWLNDNPIQAKDGEKEKEKDCKFDYKLLPIDKPPPLPIDSIPEPVLQPLKCQAALVVPIKPITISSFKFTDFIGTLSKPTVMQASGDQKSMRSEKSPFEGLKLYLFNSENGKLEATTIITAGGYTFSKIAAGRKSLFYRTKGGNLVYADSLQVCGRSVNKDGKSCTE